MDKKRKKLRHSEYYGMQETFDNLYARSKNGNNFYNLIEIMKSEDNIRLAYRNIKRNTGSKTAGIDGLNIQVIEQLTISDVIYKIGKMFDKYKPQAVRRVLIPKDNGDFRPLGIPTIWDRLFQQCILQILEPIAEAKFHNHSYGFRPNRSTHHAIARMNFLVNKNKLHYCVDVDIKGFFDHVNHAKLIKQLWTLGIRDKNLLSIIGRLLKAEIEKEGFPNEGTPQGGILSPLLSNIVLNELDWWVSDQWETFETKHNYNRERTRNGKTWIEATNKYRALKNSKLKEIFIVRYADDFKILCRDYQTAQKMFNAVKDFLKTRLKLDISPTKSKVINLRKQGSDFLGIRIKAVPKKKSFVAQSQMTNKAKKKVKDLLKEKIKNVQRKPIGLTVRQLNITILGIQNYYKVATRINKDLSEIDFFLRFTMNNRLKNKWKNATFTDAPQSFKRRYRNAKNIKLHKIDSVIIAPLHVIKHKSALSFNQDICNYTKLGRTIIHENLKFIDKNVLKKIMKSYSANRSIEYNDNRISKFIAQYGKCHITRYELDIGDIHCHHIIPKFKGGTDEYKNLVIVSSMVHKLIHMTDETKIAKYIKVLEITEKQLLKLNKLRIQADRYEIAL